VLAYVAADLGISSFTFVPVRDKKAYFEYFQQVHELLVITPTRSEESGASQCMHATL
jgi:hypothetical protein